LDKTEKSLSALKPRAPTLKHSEKALKRPSQQPPGRR